MARYTGPKTKIARKFGEPIFGPDKSFERKKYPPGQHHGSLNKSFKKVSEYGIQLREKQKVKYTYGLLERQFRNLYDKASRMKGRKGENLIMLLESRLDNTVYRLGLAPSRPAARQLVSHCHILVNGHVCNIPSLLLTPGSVLSVRERSKSLEVIRDSLGSIRTSRFSWLEWNGSEMSAKFLNRPDRTEIPEIINEQLIVELYSKS
ncbi:MAG: 30S ribosomal protein S4 [Prevotellaceae bacterium]|jgi:small subunit ribosomal protein S4|nr:30S ribosomal protein S4 [Prevotellaceae bacterium]